MIMLRAKFIGNGCHSISLEAIDGVYTEYDSSYDGYSGYAVIIRAGSSSLYISKDPNQANAKAIADRLTIALAALQSDSMFGVYDVSRDGSISKAP